MRFIKPMMLTHPALLRTFMRDLITTNQALSEVTKVVKLIRLFCASDGDSDGDPKALKVDNSFTEK